MASGDDSPSSLHGQPWSVWAEKLGRDSPQSDEDGAGKTDRKQGDAMKLHSEEMCYYGLCPVRDDFYLVVCNMCNKVCTPQALQGHIESRHPPSPLPAVPEATPVSALTGGPAPPSRSKGKKNTSSATPFANASSINSKPVPDIMATKAPPTSCRPRKDRHKERSNAKLPTSIPFELPLPPPTLPPSLPPSPLFSTPPSPSPAPAACLSNITMTVNLDPSGVPTVQIHLPEPEEGNSLLGDDLLGNPVAVATDLIGPKTTSKKRKNSKTDRKCLPLKDREFDPEKHCGVWMPENARPCTRSLTCKAHSLSLRRAVTGRSKAFDDLLATHRAAKETSARQNNASVSSVSMSSTSLASTILQSSASSSSSATVTLATTKPAKSTKNVTSKATPVPHSSTKSTATTLPLHIQTGGDSNDFKAALQQPSHSPLLIPVGGEERPSSPIYTTLKPPQPLASCTFGLKSCGSLWTRAPGSRSWNAFRNSLKPTFSHHPAPSQPVLPNGVLHHSKRSAAAAAPEDFPADFEWKSKRWKLEPNFVEQEPEPEFVTSYTNGLHLSPDPLLDPFEGLEMLEGLVGEDGVLNSDIMNFPLGFNLGLGPGGNVTFSDSGGSGGGSGMGSGLSKNSIGGRPTFLTTPSTGTLTPTGATAPMSFPQALGHQVLSGASSTASQGLTFKWMSNSSSVTGSSNSSGHVRSTQGPGPNSHAHLQLLLQADTEHT